jgi:hypothetical protein
MPQTKGESGVLRGVIDRGSQSPRTVTLFAKAGIPIGLTDHTPNRETTGSPIRRQPEIGRELLEMSPCAVMILVYGDESADEKRERVCAVAGVVGTIMAWRSVERQWINITNGIPFHANDCDSDQGDFKQFSHAENKQLYRDLSTLVAGSHLHGYGLAIDLMAANRVFPRAAEFAYYRAFLRVMQIMKDCAMANGEVADFTFDMRMESDHNAGLLYGITREYEPEWSPYLADKITFEFSRKTPRLQVADLVAREVMKALDNQIGPIKRDIRKSWKVLRDTGRFDAEAYSDDWFDDLKSHYAELEEAVGFRQQDYVNWLNQHNRLDGVTNMFLFVRDMAKRDFDAKIGRTQKL